MEISAVFGAGFVIFILIALVIGVGSMALWVWGLIDAATRPDWVFERARSSKVLWIVLIVILGAIPAIIYLLSIRPRLIAVQDGVQAAGWDPGPTGWAGRPGWSSPGGWQGASWDSTQARASTQGWDSTQGWAGTPSWDSTRGSDRAQGAGGGAGWYDDPSGRHRMRFWDGGSWTDSVWDGGSVLSDPLPH